MIYPLLKSTENDANVAEAFNIGVLFPTKLHFSGMNRSVLGLDGLSLTWPRISYGNKPAN